VVDLKKEIKLSDLKPSLKRSSSGTAAQKPRTKKRGKSELVGLKIGASQLAAAHVVNDGGQARLVQVAREPLEHGIVVGGEVRDVAALGTALDSFFEKSGMPRKNVRLGIGTNRVGVRLLEVDGITDESQLGNAVTFRAHEALSIPMDQAVLDYHVIDSNAGTRRVVVAAAYRDPIDQVVNACNLAGLGLVGIDVEAFALLRAVHHDRRSLSDEPTALIAVAIGHDRTTLATSDGTVCDFTRVLAWGGSKLDAAISRELGISEEEAAALKEFVSLSTQTTPVENDFTERDLERARAAVERELGTLARELVASLQFYQAQPSSHAIDEILITGGATRMNGFAEALERLIRARVRVADPLSAVQVAKPEMADRDDLSSLSVAIGLGVEA
jgi:type IV pilus assembly protein PilM